MDTDVDDKEYVLTGRMQSEPFTFTFLSLKVFIINYQAFYNFSCAVVSVDLLHHLE